MDRWRYPHIGHLNSIGDEMTNTTYWTLFLADYTSFAGRRQKVTHLEGDAREQILAGIHW